MYMQDFPNNKYFKWYLNICNNAKNKILCPNIYTEIHHIYPKSIYGQNKDLVKLTAKEHYIVHLLLWQGFKFEYGKSDFRTIKMAFAFTMMSSFSKDHKNCRYNSKDFEFKRQAYSEAVSANNKGRNLGIHRLQEVIEKIKKTKAKNGTFISDKQKIDISNTLKLYYETNVMVRKGKTNKEFFGEDKALEISKKISNSKKGKKQSKEHIENTRLSKIGHDVTKETREKISKKLSGRKKSKEISEKTRLKNIGKKRTDAQRANMVGKTAGEKNGMYGKTNYDIWVEKYGKEEADIRQMEFIKKVTAKSSGKNNPMYGKSFYDIWVEKYGKEEADIRMKNKSDKRKQTNIDKKLKNNI